MTALETRDVFTDGSLIVDPYSYYKQIRDISPVFAVPGRAGIMLVTGFEECKTVLSDEDLFSALTASPGPVMPLPFTPEGDDINEQLESNRSSMPLFDMVTSMDGEAHRQARGLLNKLFVPSRLKANEQYMVDLATKMAGDVVAAGHCEMMRDVSTPFVTLVIADLLGVPAEDRQRLTDALANNPTLYDIDDPIGSMAGANGYLEMAGTFYGYFEDRRANPREDILTQFAEATYPDGSRPESGELVKIAMTLFGAGQDTSAKLLGNSTRFLCENPEMQDTLRADPSLIGAFLEEMMRIEGSVKMTSRVATRTTMVGDTEVPAGTVLGVVVAAANRDPRRWEDPDSFKLKRPRAAEHVGFGRGSHVCIGAPLARAEVRIFLDRLLGMTSLITMAEDQHGQKSDRTLLYEKSYGMRGLRELHVNFTPA